MKRSILIGVVLMIAGVALAVEGYRSTLCFGTGNAVHIEFFGDKDDIYEYVLSGDLNGQRVQYKFSELKEIIFSEYESKQYALYNARYGEVIVVSRSGKRFILTSACAGNRDGEIKYCYIDPMTESRRFTQTRIYKNIASIKIGEHVGSMKKNPETTEFFPAIYSFDPFTGQKLIWANPVE